MPETVIIEPTNHALLLAKATLVFPYVRDEFKNPKANQSDSVPLNPPDVMSI